VPEEIIPDSPEDIRIPVPSSGWVSPMSPIGTPPQSLEEVPSSDDLL
jgi:hypothetical protein